MAEREIVRYPDPILRKPAVSISKPDTGLKILIDDMIATLKLVNGLGLAANQVGVLQKVLVYDEGKGPGCILNPKIMNMEGEQTGPEGCLSFPGLQGDVRRADKIEVRGNNIKGKPVKIKAEGLLARILQHEIDHLNGTLFIDRADPETLHYVTANDDEEDDEDMPESEQIHHTEPEL